PEDLGPINFMEDAEGNVWKPVPGIGGVLKFFNKYIDVYTVDDGLPSYWVYSLSEDSKSHSIWIANQKSISCIYRNRIFNFSYPLRHEIISWVSVQQDSLWLSSGGIFLYKISYNPLPRLKLLKYWVLGNEDMTWGVARTDAK